MPRAATTSDTFNAIAEPRRRDILDYLAPRERPVGDIVVALGLAQPSVSKHLRVLRDVGLVDVRRDGRQSSLSHERRGDQTAPRMDQLDSNVTGATSSAGQRTRRAQLRHPDKQLRGGNHDRSRSSH